MIYKSSLARAVDWLQPINTMEEEGEGSWPSKQGLRVGCLGDTVNLLSQRMCSGGAGGGGIFTRLIVFLGTVLEPLFTLLC